MDNLRLILIIVASLAIIALLIHGFWINKKERSTIFNTKSNKKKSKGNDDIALSLPTANVDQFDDVSEVRVKHSSTPPELQTESIVDYVIKDEPAPIVPMQRDLFAEEADVTETVEKAPALINEERKASVESQPAEISSSAETKSDATSEPVVAGTVKNDVLVLHVTGLNGDMLKGDSLLTSILQSGFQFGEMQIFHRHVDPAGNGPVLFSLANMVKPGYLDPELMHELQTPGISLFMMIPSYGDSRQNFKMMLQAAQRIADDVNGVVLDDEHHMITPQKIDNYKERIKLVVGG